jgi:hypothetical protein
MHIPPSVSPQLDIQRPRLSKRLNRRRYILLPKNWRNPTQRE